MEEKNNIYENQLSDAEEQLKEAPEINEKQEKSINGIEQQLPPSSNASLLYGQNTNNAYNPWLADNKKKKRPVSSMIKKIFSTYKNLSKKKKVAVIALLAVLLVIISSQFRLNKTSDEEFLNLAVPLVTLDYSDYKEARDSTDGLNYLKRVKLCGYIGKAEFITNIGDKKYIVELTWTTKDKDSYTDLIEYLTTIYGDKPSENEEEATCTWKIYSFSQDNKNLSSIKLSKTDNGDVLIVWETANSAYIIDNDIKNIEEVTLESKDELDRIKREYSVLDEAYKEYVDNYDILEKHYDEYYMLYVDYFDETAEKCNKTKSVENYDTAVELLGEYSKLDKKYQSLIKKYEVAKEAKNNSKAVKHDDVIKSLDSCCKSFYLYEGSSSIKSLIEKNIEVLSVDEIEKYLAYAVYDDAVSNAEAFLKLYLKNPNSYYRYDYGVGKYAFNKSDNLYYVSVSLEYGATNSFNAMIKSDKTIYVYYRVDNNGIKKTKTEFSAYDQWKMSK